MAATIISLPLDNVAGLVTPTLPTGTADAQFPLPNLYDGKPYKAFMTTSTGGVDILYDFGAAQRIDQFFLRHHNLLAGANVRWQSNTTNSFGAPPFDAAVTILPYNADGLPDGGPVVDLTGVSGYLVGGRQFWRLHIPAPSPAQITALGELWLGTTKRTLPQGVRLGVQKPLTRDAVINETDGGAKLVYDVGMTNGAIIGQILTTDAAVAMEAIWRAVKGPVLPFMVWLDPAINDGRLVRWMTPFQPVQVEAGIYTVNFTWEEEADGAKL